MQADTHPISPMPQRAQVSTDIRTPDTTSQPSHGQTSGGQTVTLTSSSENYIWQGKGSAFYDPRKVNNPGRKAILYEYEPSTESATARDSNTELEGSDTEIENVFSSLSLTMPASSNNRLPPRSSAPTPEEATQRNILKEEATQRNIPNEEATQRNIPKATRKRLYKDNSDRPEPERMHSHPGHTHNQKLPIHTDQDFSVSINEMPSVKTSPPKKRLCNPNQPTSNSATRESIRTDWLTQLQPGSLGYHSLPYDFAPKERRGEALAEDR